MRAVNFLKEFFYEIKLIGNERATLRVLEWFACLNT